MQNLQPPEKFSFKPEEWSDWMKTFRRYRNASKLSKEDGVTQRDTLLYTMGSEGEKIFATLKFETLTIGEGADARQVPEDEDFERLVKKFDDYFLVKRNIIHERTKFQERKQLESETVEEFYRALCSLVTHCEYRDTDELVRDRLVVGLRDIKLKEKLQLTTDLTLDKALDISRQHEQIKEQMKSQQATGDSAVTDEAKQNERSKFSDRGRDRMKYRSRGGRGNNRGRGMSRDMYQMSENKCGQCGFEHTKDQYCPAKFQRCHKCSRKGHFERCCRSVQELDAGFEHYEEDDVYNIGCVISDNKNAWTTKLRIKDTDIEFKIDTGADITIINEKTYERMKRKPKLSRARVQLTSPGGKLTVRGEFYAQTVTNGKQFKFRIIVVRNRVGSNLLSRSVSEKMGFVKRVNELQQNADIFGHTGLLKTDPVNISLKEGAKPYNVTTARRIPFPLQKKVKSELDRMLQDGIIEEVKQPTEWCASMVPIVKPSGAVRICVDFKKLNENVRRPNCMLPNLDDIAPDLSGSKYFSTLDASSGFFQIPLSEESSLLTTFITPFGRFAFKRVPMGISLGPECFQTKMTETLEGLEGCKAIMDDTIIYGKTEEEHDQRLSAVLKRIEESGLKLNKEKCNFKQTEVKFFGHIISAEGVKPNPEKIKAIVDMPPPTNVSELRTVCGMFQYMSKFVPEMATILKPMTDLMKKDIAWTWGDSQQNAFDHVKEKLVSAQTLGYYDPRRQTVVSADSSSYGLGATICQLVDGHLKPIAYASRTLTDAETRYAQIEKECLASVWACEKFSQYLIGLDKFELQTDHKPLVPLMRSKDINQAPARCQRLLIRLMRFNADVVHVPGKQIVISDALSRHPRKHTEEDELETAKIKKHVEVVDELREITSYRMAALRAATVHDQVIQQVMSYVLNGWPRSIPPNLQAYAQIQSELSIINGLLVYQDRIVVPETQRDIILEKLHETHQGLTKCRLKAKGTVWWPKLSLDLKNTVENCKICQENRPSQRNEPLKPTPLPNRPWEKLGTDLCHFKGKDYLVVIDYYSRWIEIVHLHSTSSATVIRKLTELFATHGVCDLLISDNGPQFNCMEFRRFVEEFDFKHETSSPYFPQSNGEAESAVKIAKKLLEQKSLDLALLNYRTTPHSSTGVCPCVALMGRQLKTKVPILPQNLQPQKVKDSEIRENDHKAKENYKHYYDKRHGAVPLSTLNPGDQVLIKTDSEKKWNNPGQVVAADKDKRTYLINTPSGVLRRNRKHIQKLPTAALQPPLREKTDTRTRTPTCQLTYQHSRQMFNFKVK